MLVNEAPVKQRVKTTTTMKAEQQPLAKKCLVQ